MLPMASQVSIDHAYPHSLHSNDHVDPFGGPFCHSAIQCDSRDFCITPVGSNLLKFPERWKMPRYGFQSEPAVFDFSPKVLGLAEGFLQAG